MARKNGMLLQLNSREYDGQCRFRTNFIRSLLQNANNLYRKDLYAHYGCVNAIEFSADGEWLASGGDDRRVLLWNMSKTISTNSYPHIMKGEHNSNIFCLGFDPSHTKVFSAGNDEQVIVHNIESGETLDVFNHEEAVYGLSVDPLNSDVFASACDNGQILIWDTRQPSSGDPLVLAQSSSAFHAVVHNPAEPRLLATANSREGVALWDIRRPRICMLRFGGCLSAQSSMSVRFSRGGLCLLALRRRLPPVLYNISSPCPVVEFDHPGYYNSCTMKSCTFAGDNDQYVMSGSDDFKLYMWKIPPECNDKKGLWVNEAHMVLKGHRSIVNQVRYSPATSLLASSGVEKVVKLWSLFPLPGGEGSLEGEPSPAKVGVPKPPQDPRRVYSHEEYINLVLESGQFMTHDYSHKSMNEDQRMMAFFDSLVQRDIEGWTSDSSESSISPTGEIPCLEVQSSPATSPISSLSSSSSSSSNHDSSGDELSLPTPDENLVPHTLSYITALTNRVEANLMNLQQQNGHSEGNNSAERMEGDDANRISQLIARKRHEQLLRAARSTVKQTQKRLKRSKKGSKFVRNANKVLDAEEKTLDGARKILDLVLLKQTQNQDQRDRRKALRKRRVARLWRSDSSDISSDEHELRNLSVANYSRIRNENSVIIPSVEIAVLNQNTSGVQNYLVLDNNGERQSTSNSVDAPVASSSTVTENGCEILSTLNGVSGDTQRHPEFKPTNKKSNTRNYRTRNLEDNE